MGASRGLCASGFAWLVLVLLAVSPVSAASSDEWYVESAAPPSSTGISSDPGPPVSAADARVYAAVLGLDADRFELVLQLQSEHAVAHRRSWTVAREALADARAEQAAEAASDVPPVFGAGGGESTDRIVSAFEQERVALREAFESDLRLLLTAAEDARWERVEAAKQRARTLSAWATHPGEGVDVVALLAETGVPIAGDAPLASLAREYEATLRSVLATRDRLSVQLGELASAHLEAERARSDTSPDTPERDAAQARYDEVSARVVKLALEVRDAGERVRQVNMDALDRAAAMLDGTPAETLRAAAARATRSKPRVTGFRRLEVNSRATMAFEAVLGDADPTGARRGLADLSPSQRADGLALRDSYDARFSALAARWADDLPDEDGGTLRVGAGGGTVELQRRDVPRERISFLLAGPDGRTYFSTDANERLPEAFRRAVAELDQWAIDQLRGLLTIDQRAAIAQY